MFEQLNTVIEKRIKEVLQFHLNGTSEEFEGMDDLDHVYMDEQLYLQSVLDL